MVKNFNSSNQNEWACVLGGGSGLGLASAKKLALHGMHICIIHRTRRSQLEKLAKEIEEIKECNVLCVDFNLDALQNENISSVKEFFIKDSKKVKVLLHSIAKGNLKPIISDIQKNHLSAKDFTLTIDAMALSLYAWVEEFLEAKLFSPQASILAFTSAGSRKTLPNYAAVGAAKATLEALIRSLAYELAPLHITANCIEAGVTKTESLLLIPGSDKLIEEALKHNPNERLTLPEDVANAVYLLALPEARWITGTIIPVDGGEHLR